LTILIVFTVVVFIVDFI